MITRENYEIWFLDFAEGSLTPAQQTMLFAFLENHADLKKEFEAFETISLTEITEPKPTINLKKKKSWLLEKYTLDELVFNVCEGNLNAEELREWSELATTNPSLRERVAHEQKLTLRPYANEKLEFKVALKKHESNILLTPDNCQEYFIAYAETKNLLVYNAIQTFIAANPAYQRDFELVQKTVLKPDSTIVFAYKNELKQNEDNKVVGLYWWKYAAVAACIAVGVFFFYPNTKQQHSTLAEITDTVKEHKTQKAPVVHNPNAIAGVLPEEKTETHETPNTNPLPNKNDKKQQNIEQNNQNKFVQQQQNNQNTNNTANLLNNKKEKPDTTVKHTPIPENKPQELYAQNPVKTNNGTPKQQSPVTEKDASTPLEFVASVVNKKYYEETTPKNEQTSPFYAMKNVVNTVSSGSADISRKEDEEYKEFGIKLGNFKFSRKKVKNREE